MQLAEAEFVEATVDPDLQAKLATLLDDIAELDRQLEDGEIPVSVYAKAASVAERDREALQELIDEVGSTGSVVQLSQQAQKDRDAARHLLVTLIDPATAEHAAKADTSQIPNARRLLKDTLGQVVVRTGRGSAEERVTIESA
jgi:transcription elongation GreA/GreB family factor